MESIKKNGKSIWYNIKTKQKQITVPKVIQEYRDRVTRKKMDFTKIHNSKNNVYIKKSNDIKNNNYVRKSNNIKNNNYVRKSKSNNIKNNNYVSKSDEKKNNIKVYPLINKRANIF